MITIDRSRVLLAALVICGFGVLLPARAQATSADWEYFAREFKGKGATVPACTPLSPKVYKKRVTLRDPNSVWGRISLPRVDYESAKRFQGFDECVGAVVAYKGRYTAEHLAALSKGELAAGMPFEFALMILGPPTQAPGLFSMINPVTGKPETYRTYMWMHLFGKMGPLRTAFSIVGTLALGVAGVTDNLGTAVDALKVANAAATAELMTWEVSGLSKARVVTIQVDDKKQIRMLMAQ